MHTLGSKDERGRISSRVLLRLMRFVQPYWLHLCAAACCMLLSSGGNLLSPYLTKVAIDENIAFADAAGLLLTSVKLAGALTLVYLASAAQTYLLSWVGQQVLTTLRVSPRLTTTNTSSA